MRNKQKYLFQTSQRASRFHRQGKLDEAERLYREILSVEPSHLVALTQIGLMERPRGPNARAFDLNGSGSPMNPDDVDTAPNMDRLGASPGIHEQALENCNKTLASRPGDPTALNNRGVALIDLKRPAEALASFDLALASKAAFAEAHNNRGNALKDLGRAAEALESHDRALALAPNYAEALNNRGNALTELGRPEEALASYDRALALKPDYVAAHENRGILLTEIGRFDEASQAIEKAIALAPTRVHSYYSLTQSKRLTVGDPNIKAMEDLARDVQSLAVDEQIELHFALGKALADTEEHLKSFRHLLLGNALKRSQIEYDESATLEVFEGMPAAFSEEMVRSAAGLGDPSTVPIFIVGMPRSGTTLVEQILASHPKVFGAGETDEFANVLAAADEDIEDAPLSPEEAALSWARRLRKLGKAYVTRTRALAPKAARITDKTLENFRIVGLIHLALPNARIIHARRDPLDTCLSCFSRQFVGRLPYTYDLAELGRHYRAYETLMSHWRSVIPPRTLLDVQYEDVITDIEGQGRRIVAHCGLEWDRRCLDFHMTERAVRTASATQVRRPIYNSSVGRWRAYESVLQPLINELGPSIAPPPLTSGDPGHNKS